MEDCKRIQKIFFAILSLLRNSIKSIYIVFLRRYYKYRYLNKGKFVYIAKPFRFSCLKPYSTYIGDWSHIEEYNVWNAKSGSIKIGKNNFIGLHNIIMGPIDIGNNVSTGPYVKILGPRHAVNDYKKEGDKKTIIGNNVWISSGAIISFNVTIGDNAIIAPGAVVTKNVADGSLVAGNPARDITNLSSLRTKLK